MNAPASPAISSEQSIVARLRTFLIASVFALVLLIPKLLSLRHNPQAWLIFRILLGLAGAALVIVPLSFATGWLAPIFGLAIFLAAILLPAAKAADLVAQKAGELGALVVVNGGEYQPFNGGPAGVQLFVSSDSVFVLDSGLHALLQIAVPDISSIHVAEVGHHWILRICWADRAADFKYQGFFAEHLARVAESTIRSVLRLPLPVFQERRAARA
jgi:hypothetical protein